MDEDNKEPLKVPDIPQKDIPQNIQNLSEEQGKEEKEEKPKKWRKWLIIILSLLIIFSLGFYFLNV